MTLTPTAQKRFLPVSEVAFLLATSESTVRRMIDRGDLPAVRLGSGRTSWRVSESALFDFARRFGDLDPADFAARPTEDELQALLNANTVRCASQRRK